MGRVGNSSSHEPPEPLAVESGRVILGFDFRANRVNNRVKNQLFRVKIEQEKKNFWVKIELGKFFFESNQVQFF